MFEIKGQNSMGSYGSIQIQGENIIDAIRFSKRFFTNVISIKYYNHPLEMHHLAKNFNVVNHVRGIH